MAFSALSLTTTTGVQGRPFAAVLNGLQTGSTIEMSGDGSPGFSYVNGRFSSDRLPYPVSTLVFFEVRPGEGRKEWRFDIQAAGAPVLSIAPDGTTSYSGAGGAPIAQSGTASAAGAVYTVSRLLGSSSTLALISGTNSNLTLNATTGVISAASAIAVGASQTAKVSETLGDLRVDYPVVITGISAGTPTPTPGPTEVTAVSTGTAAFRALGISSERQVFPITNAADLKARSGSGAVSQVPVSVTFTGSPTAIECRSVSYDDGSEITPWSTVSTSPTGGTWTGNVPMAESPNWQRLQFRPAGGTIFATSARIGAGIVIGIEGQSQARYFIANVSSGGSVTAGDKVSAYGKAGLLETGSGGNGADASFGVQGWYQAAATASVSGTTVLGGGGSGAAAAGNALVSALNVPVAFVANAPGGRAMAYINTTSRPEALARYAETGRPNLVIMLSHGTQDVNDGTSEATYQAALETWRGWHESDANAKPRDGYMIMPLIRQTGGTTASNNAIKRAQQNFDLANADVYYAGSGYDVQLADTVHQSDTGNAVIGRRIGYAIARRLGVTIAGSLGPTMASATVADTTVSVTVDLNDGATALTNVGTSGATGTLTPAGFSVSRESDGAAVTINSVALNGANKFDLTLASAPGEAVRVRSGVGTSPGAAWIADDRPATGQSRGNPLQYDLNGIVATYTGGGTPTPTPTPTSYTQWTGPGWFDASDTAGGDVAITTLVNKRSGGGDLTRGGTGGSITSVSAAQNGRNAIRLVRDISSASAVPYLAAADNAPISTMWAGDDLPYVVLLVFKPTDTNTGYPFAASRVNGSAVDQVAYVSRNGTASSVRKKSGTASQNDVTASSANGDVVGTPIVVAIRHTGTSLDIWYNSTTKFASTVAQDTAALGTPQVFRLFAVMVGSGIQTVQKNLDFYELVIETASHSDAEIQKAITDLATKWGGSLA
ncbi:hypothetical protein [Sphingomonas sp. Leaf10]|uniref:hypothetical protein n=1 Tax=Sphingomonas sp. Leaf10 TaxID=1735676 RepID=UPI000701BB4A|nr:hypothetical protein [Sphingomonas sp. Leaf10]KQM37943.1 hypothetical protein ASE59_11630 [Sphingomonas sp. Leaf10]